MDGKPMYDVGYEFATDMGSYARVTQIYAGQRGPRYIACDDKNRVYTYWFDAAEMTTPWVDFVAAETDRLIAQLNALPKQTRRAVALTGEERALLRSLLLYYCGNAATDTLRHDGEALYDKLNAGVEAGE